jgi:hypothetical protein
VTEFWPASWALASAVFPENFRAALIISSDFTE